MGTNYYARSKICSCCGRYEEIHIGKSSSGWTFGFHATDKITSCKAWFEFLSQKGVEIYDEYGENISLEMFKKIVLEKQKHIYDNHSEIYKGQDGNYLDDEGYSMTTCNFSQEKNGK